MTTVLVLGGARSGKSRVAEEIALRSARRPVYVATAGPARDEEMAARTAHHRARRGGEWRTVEEPLALAETLVRECGPDTVVVVDCLTLWLANLMEQGRDIEPEIAGICDTLAALKGPAILVSNEVGGGIVPENALARAFRDHQGRLNQALARSVDTALLVVAGRTLVLPPEAPDIKLV